MSEIWVSDLSRLLKKGGDATKTGKRGGNKEKIAFGEKAHYSWVEVELSTGDKLLF